MLNITEEAKKGMGEFLKGKDLNVVGLRIPVSDGKYFDLEAAPLTEVGPQDGFVEVSGIMFIFEKALKDKLEGATIDYVPGGILPGRYVIDLKAPLPEGLAESPDLSDPNVKKIQDILDQEINPSIAMHGGFASMLGYKDNILYLQMGGGCQGCGMVDVTLKQGIEARLRQDIPDLAGIVDQTDHAGGTNPYFQPGK